MSLSTSSPTVWTDAAEVTASRRLWAATMLTPDVEVCRSILLGRSVLARQLDASALRRALRGAPFPDPADYIAVMPEMLDAVAEGGPFQWKARRR